MGCSRWTPSTPQVLLEHEARALLARLARLKPFALHKTMVPAAVPSRAAQAGDRGVPRDGTPRAARAHRRVSLLDSRIGPPGDPRAGASDDSSVPRLRFNVVLSDFDVFADVLTQRSEHETGPWLAGLDVVAADALGLAGRRTAPP